MRPNLLIISIEDLNDWIEPLAGHPDTQTPNINRLSSRGVLFLNAYSNVPACAPSRNSALFGQAPWMTGSYSNASRWTDCYPKGAGLSMIGAAKKAGYQTYGAGKFFYGADKGIDSSDWSHYFVNKRNSGADVSYLVKSGLIPKSDDFGPIDTDEDSLWDNANTSSIIETMTAGSEGKIWALGLYRPHLPFKVPIRFFNKIKWPPNPPKGLSGKEFYDDWDLGDVPAAGKSLISGEKLLNALKKDDNYLRFIHAYLASISYADELLGKLLDHLDDSNLWDNTLVVLWSDHGWQFGEKTAFKKFTLWERSLRVPLIIAGPNFAQQRICDPVSLLDLYPTIANLLDLDPGHRLDGTDLTPALLGNQSYLKNSHAISVYAKSRYSSELAVSVRDKRFRFTKYWDGSEEFYDHHNDTFETTNLICEGRIDTTNAELFQRIKSLRSIAENICKISIPATYNSVRSVKKSRNPLKKYLQRWLKKYITK